MSTAVVEQPRPQVAPTTEKTITYVPLGSKVSVDLTMNLVRKYLCTPTRQGNHPTDSDVVKFMMLCKARELDPWVGDAYLVGYDANDGPQFSLITAAQALLKRAEMSEHFDGMESGVVVKGKDSEITFRDGDLVLDDETLVGGWARCFRKDRSRPSYDSLKLSTFSTGRSRWQKDPAGMIVKCAEASVLRKSFPTQLGGLYTREEMDHLSQTRIDNRDAGAIAPMRAASNLDELAARLEEPPKPAPQQIESQQDTDPEPGDDWQLPWEAALNECETSDDFDRVSTKVVNSGMPAKRMGEVNDMIRTARDRKFPPKSSGGKATQRTMT